MTDDGRLGAIVERLEQQVDRLEAGVAPRILDAERRIGETMTRMAVIETNQTQIAKELTAAAAADVRLEAAMAEVLAAQHRGRGVLATVQAGWAALIAVLASGVGALVGAHYGK